MDELAKALAEAIRAGSQLAGPAVVGYYVVRLTEELFTVGGFLGALLIVKSVVLRSLPLATAKWEARAETYKAYKLARDRGLRDYMSEEGL